MKKILSSMFVAIGIMTITACTDQQEPDIPFVNDSQTEQINPLITVALDAYESCYGSTSRATATFYETDVVPLTRLKSRASMPDTVMYIVNEANGNGFVAVTGGDNPEILAVTDNGYVNNVDDIEIPGLKTFFDAATDYAEQSVVSGATNSGGEILEPIPLFKEEVISCFDYCRPRCQTKWGQSYPEGLFCPNSISGCVITAMAQALSYFEKPESITLTYPDADKPNVTLNWQNIKNTVQSMSWFDKNHFDHDRTEIQLESEYNLGRLCRELGHRVGAFYNTSSTGAYTQNGIAVIRNLCPTLSVSNFINGAPVARNVLGDGVIVMEGRRFYTKQDSINQNYANTSGHAWIVDGYQYEWDDHRMYYYDSSSQSYIYSAEDSYTKVTLDLQHINWGWGGQCNGFFNIGVFRPNAAVKPDTDSNSSSYNYSFDFKYYIISPK